MTPARATGPRAHQPYRPDIDGLRAVAVTSVILFHIALIFSGGGIRRFLGGYVGVDVFFVISGFLITTIIRAQLDRDRFSLRDFYARRAGRILPALVVVVVVSSVVVAQYMLPPELNDYGVSVAATAFSLSNVYFWLHTGYFSGPGESKVLLHTWSLAVEEQFYIGWPLVLAAVSRRARLQFGWVLAVICVISFVISVVMVRREPDGAFYLVFGRVWELLVGAALTLELCRQPLPRGTREAMTAIGLIGILAAIFLYTPETPFPGWAALPPCLGAALIIWGGASGPTIVGRCLAWRPVVFIGLISYSLYLWHWPVIEFEKARLLFEGTDAGRFTRVGVVVVSLVLATLSWRFVERPFRTGVVPRKYMLWVGGAACICLALLGAGLTRYVAGRFTPEDVHIASFLKYVGDHQLDCQLQPTDRASEKAFAPCMPASPAKPSVLLFGDSHANHLAPALVEAYPGIDLVRLSGSSCKPAAEGIRDAMCGSLLHFLRTEVLPKRHFSAVLLAGRWEDVDLPDLTDFIAELKTLNVPIVLFGPINQFDQPLPRLMVNANLSHDPGLVERHRLALAALDRKMAELAKAQHVEYISLLSALCPGDHCTYSLQNGDPLQYDYGHLTIEGARLLVDRLKRYDELQILDGLAAKGGPAG